MEVMIIKAVLTVIFTVAIVGKLTGKTKATFQSAGYNPALMYAIAIAEIIFTAGLFTSYDVFATIGLLGIIGGAVFTLVRQKASMAHIALPLITAMLLCALLVFQYSEFKSQFIAFLH